MIACESRYGTWTLSDARSRFDLPLAHRWIAEESYWASGIPLETFRRAVDNSLTVGAYAANGQMTAMARAVTDRATFAWIGDVFVDASHRGLGLGKLLMTYLRSHPDLQGLRRQHLVTRDAHGLYSQFGFAALTDTDRWMEIRDDAAYRR